MFFHGRLDTPTSLLTATLSLSRSLARYPAGGNAKETLTDAAGWRRVKPGRADPSRAEKSRAESRRSEPSRAEPSQAEPSQLSRVSGTAVGGDARANAGDCGTGHAVTGERSSPCITLVIFSLISALLNVCRDVRTSPEIIDAKPAPNIQ